MYKNISLTAIKLSHLAAIDLKALFSRSSFKIIRLVFEFSLSSEEDHSRQLLLCTENSYVWPASDMNKLIEDFPLS